jgi:xylulokinase
VEPSLGVTALPYLDGERTPYLPTASGVVVGLRHGTPPGAILMAAYEGAVASLIDALDALEQHSSGIDPDAPLVLIGGGSRGHAWREVCARLSGRRLLVPASDEHVALGAAVQAAAILTGAAPDEIAAAWKTRQGVEIEAVPRDTETLERIRTLVHTVSEGGQRQAG